MIRPPAHVKAADVEAGGRPANIDEETFACLLQRMREEESKEPEP